MRTRLIKYIGILSFLLFISTNVSSQSSVTKVIYPDALGENDRRQRYFIDLLNLALEHSKKEYGPYKLIISDTPLPSVRVPQMILTTELISVMSSPETDTLNNKLLKVPIPLLMGVQGLRLSLIHEDNKNLFKNTNELASLEPLIFGQGIGWVDTKILVDNGLKVQTAAIYDSLFGMVSQKRVHAFPRGLNEIYQELEAWGEQYPNLYVDPHIALYYPLPVNFYVNPADPALKDRLVLGLNNAKDSGDFDQLFNQHFADILEKANIEKRRIFILKNQYNPSQFAPQFRRHLLPALQNVLGDAN